MSNDSHNEDFQSEEEWATYLAVFLEESDEDLESLMQALLRLEQSPEDSESLNEAFRLLHTHKGSAGLMGFTGISELAHELENRFENYRSGKEKLDSKRITVLLSCVDFLKAFNSELKAGNDPSQDANKLLQQLEEAESTKDPTPSPQTPMPQPAAGMQSLQGGYRVRVEFQEGLQLADLKARLIVARLANIGEIIATEPDIEEIKSVDHLDQFAVILLTDKKLEEVQEIANVDGVKNVFLDWNKKDHPDIEAGPEETSMLETSDFATPVPVAPEPKKTPVPEYNDSKPDTNTHGTESSEKEVLSQLQNSPPAVDPPTEVAAETPRDVVEVEHKTPKVDNTSKTSANITESVRVGIDRLDNLMNLTGELVVTQSRLSQLVNDMASFYRSGSGSSQTDDWVDQLRIDLEKLEKYLARGEGGVNGAAQHLKRLRNGVESVDEQFTRWDSVKRQFVQVAETSDQLDRVSDHLQKSVLATRMVPVAPLFNRFRRVIRDLADERQKKVRLLIRGENTELDKRMIDELSDPLLHLVRNSIDHGLEPPAERQAAGKSEIGQVTLEASHRGNNVFISIKDDGRGLDLEKIKNKIIDNKLASESAVYNMTEQQIIDHIWKPGFSTSAVVTDISGRGVGMDVVKSRISELNGAIDVESNPAEGTTFIIRLPLTLAIIRSLLVRFQDVYLSIPIADVLETAAVNPEQIQLVYGQEMIDLRGEIIPLVRLDRIFTWNQKDNDLDKAISTDSFSMLRVVLIRQTGHTIALVVDELFGSSDVVIKSFADNFLPIRGLSGASIMGDGAVCLMLDSGEVIKMTSKSTMEDNASHSQ